MSLDHIRSRINHLAKKIKSPRDYLPTYETPRGDGHPSIKVDGYVCHIVYGERGIEFERKTVSDIEDLLYYVFDDVTHLMASDYELRNRNENEDFRRLLFRKQIELMGRISEEYAKKLERDIGRILKVAPYVKPRDFGPN